MLNPELSGIRAHANPDGSVKAKPDFDTEARPLAHELAAAKQVKATVVEDPPFTPNNSAYTNPNTTANTSAVPTLLAAIVAEGGV